MFAFWLATSIWPMSTAGFKLLPQSSGSQNDIVYTHKQVCEGKRSSEMQCILPWNKTSGRSNSIGCIFLWDLVSTDPWTLDLRNCHSHRCLLSNIEVSEQDNPLKLWSKKHRPNRKNSLASRPSGHQSLPTHDEPRASHCSGKWKRSFGQGQQSWLSHSSPHTETSTT